MRSVPAFAPNSPPARQGLLICWQPLAAIVLAPCSYCLEDQEPVVLIASESELLTDVDVERAIAATLSGAPLWDRGMANRRLLHLLTGAQEKTALLFHRGRWRQLCQALRRRHIFSSLPLGLVGHLQMDMRDSVENERGLCARLMQAYSSG